MKKFGIQIVILVAVIFGALYIYYNNNLIEPFLPVNFSSSPTRQIKIGATIIKTEIADTPAKRTKGLSGRDSLATDSGMLFVFPVEKKYQFWMKGMKFSLDFIFIRQGLVVDLLRDAIPPPQNQLDNNLKIYEPLVPIDMMIEVNSGFIDKNNIKIGDQVLQVQ